MDSVVSMPWKRLRAPTLVKLFLERLSSFNVDYLSKISRIGLGYKFVNYISKIILELIVFKIKHFNGREAIVVDKMFLAIENCVEGINREVTVGEVQRSYLAMT
jgi:hypothetical protein